MDISKYYCNLITQRPIDYNGLIIYQPSFEQVMNYGFDEYNNLMSVYSITMDSIENIENKENLNLFEDIILNDDYLLMCFSGSIKMLTKPTHIDMVCENNHKYIVLKFMEDNINETCVTKERSFVINSSNFNELSEIILQVNASKKIEIEKPPENMTQRQREVWEKLQEGRKKDAKKNEIHIYDILNVCEYCGYYIPIAEIMQWSLWRIMNCYKTKVNMKSYDDNLQIALVSGDSKSISGDNHWFNQLVIR